MKTLFASLGYTLRTYKLDQLWLPAGFWALFALVIAFLHGRQDVFDIAGAFLGIVLPLIAGVLGAYAFLEDPALELHFATPRPAWRMLLERLGMLLGVLALAALSFQLFLAAMQVDISGLGGLAVRQLAWLAPCLATLALGCLTAFALANSTPGALVVGLVWIFQVLLRGWFQTSPWARYLYLFMGVRAPNSPSLPGNQASLFILASALLWVAWMLFKGQERYL